jgi:glycosyltransferase involved in cell wall biosynthesis
LTNIVGVSVVIPCFRCARTIKRAIESIAQQTLKPMEIILVEDASGDETLSALMEIERQYSGWVRVVALEANQGAGCARNAGWAAATQPLIAFLDADDTWHSRKIEIQYAFMNSHPEVMLCGHAHQFIDQEDLYQDWPVSEWDAQMISKGSLLVSNRFITPSVMVRRDISQRFRLGQRHMEDHMLWLEILCGGGKVVKLSAELAAIHKCAYGASGLSAQIWLMEKGDLGNYKQLYQSECINRVQWLALSAFSWIKFMRRWLICRGNRR